jgi:hypothetical protein
MKEQAKNWQVSRWLFDFLLQKLKTMIIYNNQVFDLLIICLQFNVRLGPESPFNER